MCISVSFCSCKKALVPKGRAKFWGGCVVGTSASFTRDSTVGLGQNFVCNTARTCVPSRCTVLISANGLFACALLSVLSCLFVLTGGPNTGCEAKACSGDLKTYCGGSSRARWFRVYPLPARPLGIGLFFSGPAFVFLETKAQDRVLSFFSVATFFWKHSTCALVQNRWEAQERLFHKRFKCTGWMGVVGRMNTMAACCFVFFFVFTADQTSNF